MLVTGAGGFIGRHAAAALAEAGARVIARTHSQAPLPEAVRELERIEADCVAHCAAVLPAKLGCEEERIAAEANLRIDHALLGILQTRKWRLVYLSGTNVYGSAPPPWTEEGLALPVGSYAASKLAAEARILAEGVDARILRISAPYGPGQAARTVVRVFVDAALGNRDLLYHGSGSRRQDFVAVEDVASAIVCAAAESAPSGICNIASGRTVSMKDLAHLVVSCVPGCTSRIVQSGQPDPQEDYRPVIDITRAQRCLGWSPCVPLEEGIRRWATRLQEGA